MKRPLPDLIADTALVFIRPIVLGLMRLELKVIHKGPQIKRSREPFVLISNHFNTWDSFAIMKYIKKRIRFVATDVAYLDKSKKYLLKYIARAIPKRVGKNEVVAAKKIFRSLQQGYAVGVFPEGDNTYYGETVDMFESTGKLLKRAGVDVILVKQQGGYLSQPRWADYFSKHGVVHTTTSTLIEKEQLVTMSHDEINQVVKKAIYNNDYDFQRDAMIDFRRKNRAEGIERLVYLCNQCNGVLTVYGEGHDIKCKHCGTIGTINEYEFIVGNEFDNLVDYNHYQYQFIEDVMNETFAFDVTLNIVDRKKYNNIKQGTFTVEYKDKAIRVFNQTKEYYFELNQMRYPVNTMRHSFCFDYGEVTYNMTDIRHQFVLYEMIRFETGGYKAKESK